MFKRLTPQEKILDEKVESVVDKIKNKQVEFMQNQDRLRAELDSIGGIQGLTDSIARHDQQRDKFHLLSFIQISSAAALCLLYQDHSPDMEKQIADLFTAAHVGLSAASILTSVQDFWKSYKLFSFKKEVEKAAY